MRLGRLAAAGAISGVLAVGCAHSTDVGFWFEPDAFNFPIDVPAPAGGPLTDEERRSIEDVARAELTRAFATLSVHVTSDRHAHWRVQVLPSLPPWSAGESMTFGIFGGVGAVGFDAVARFAVHYAPPAASRADILAGLGRGIGRVAVHELTHQMLGGNPSAHNDQDADSYEYSSPDRAAQYYGELHWTTALPLLRQKYGR